MSELALVALIGGVGTLFGAIATYLTTLRRVNADVHIARVTMESEGGTDDRKALRDFQNAAIAKREEELAECRLKLEQERDLKNRSIDILERLAAESDARKEATQQTGGTPS